MRDGRGARRQPAPRANEDTTVSPEFNANDRHAESAFKQKSRGISRRYESNA